MSKARNLATLLTTDGSVKTTKYSDSVGGQSDFVASGTLPNGSPVVLNSDGTVSAVAGIAGSQTVPLGSSIVAVSSGSYHTHSAFDPHNANKFVYVYQDWTGSPAKACRAIVGTVSGSTISFGTSVLVHSTDSRGNYIAFDSSVANSILIMAYNNTNARVEIKAGTISGNDIILGSTTIVSSGAASSDNNQVAFDPSNAGKFVLCFKSNTSPYGQAIAGSVSGNTVTLGSASSVGSSNQANAMKLAFDSHVNGRFAISYYDGGDSAKGKVTIGTRSANSLTLTTPYVFNNATTSASVISFDPNYADRLLIAYGNGTTDAVMKALTVTASAVTAAGSIHTLTNNSWASPSLAVNPNKAGQFVLAWGDLDATPYYSGVTMIGQVTGTTITTGSEIVDATHSQYNSVSIDPNTLGKFIITKKNDSNGYAMVRLGQLAVDSSNLTTSNFIGISSAAYADTATATLNLQGGTATNVSGLTAGTTYYAQGDGTLGASAGTPSVEVGKALSSTSILLKGI